MSVLYQFVIRFLNGFLRPFRWSEIIRSSIEIQSIVLIMRQLHSSQ